MHRTTLITNSKNPQWSYIGRGKLKSEIKYNTDGYVSDLSDAELREIRQIQIVEFFKNLIVSLTLFMVICGSSYAMFNQFAERQGIFPLNVYHTQIYNSHFGGLIRLAKADHYITLPGDSLEHFLSRFAGDAFVEISNVVKNFQERSQEEFKRVMYMIMSFINLLINVNVTV